VAPYLQTQLGYFNENELKVLENSSPLVLGALYGVLVAFAFLFPNASYVST